MPDLDILAQLVSAERRIEALQAQLRGIVFLAENHRPGTGSDAVFRNNVWTLAGRSGDEPLNPATKARLWATLIGDDRFADIINHAPGGGA